MGLFGDKRLRQLKEALESLRVQLGVDPRSSAVARYSTEIEGLLTALRAAGKFDQAVAALNQAANQEVPVAVLFRSDEMSKADLTRDLKQANPRPENAGLWAEHIQRFRTVLDR